MAQHTSRYGYATLKVTTSEDSVNISNNTSRVVVKVEIYFGGAGSAYNANNQSMSVKVNGKTIGSRSFTYSLSSGQSVTLGTYTETVAHNSDGSKSVPIAVIVSGGGDYASVSENLRLETIARQSSITSGQNWTVGENTTIVVARSSSSFTHTVWIDAWNNTGWVNVRTYTGVGTSVSSNFYDADIKNMAAYMRNGDNNRASIKTRIRVKTNNGSTSVGDIVSREGTLRNVEVSRVTADNSVVSDGIPYKIRRGSSSNYIEHDLIWRFGTFEKSLFLRNSDYNWATMTFTDAEKASIYNQVKDTNYGTGGFRLITYLAGIQVRVETTYTDVKLTFPESEIQPVITPNFTFADTVSSIVAITGSNQVALQNKSSLNIYLPANASSFKHGATGSYYSATINGVEKTVPYSTAALTIPFGVVSTGTDTTITISIVDSRGIKSSESKALTVFPYSNPTIAGILSRTNGFDDYTNIRATGNISSVNGKNSISSVQYRFKLSTTTNYSGYVNFTTFMNKQSYTTNVLGRSFENTSMYDIEFRIIDRIGTTFTKTYRLDAGKPIMFIDKKNKSVGIGKFPIYPNSLEVDKEIYVSNTKIESGTAGELRVSNSYGYIEIAPKNTSHAHIYTDRSSFYFNKELFVNGNSVFHSADFSYGSNSNGEYYRFPDGTQICTIAELTVTHSHAIRLQNVWTYPVPFLGSSVAVANRQGYHGGSDGILKGIPTADGAERTCVVRLWTSGSNYSTSDNANMRVIAIGRWK